MQWLDASQIEPALADMGSLHIEQWQKHDYGSGFTNPQFVDFHRTFMLDGLPDSKQDSANHREVNVHVAKFTAGEIRLGYLYFFTHAQQVYFYLSAINYHSQDNKYKPGLLMHKLAMTHFAEQGYTHYDFLAGDSRYKTSLSNEKYLLHNLQLYVNRWYYSPIKLCVNIKRWFAQRAKK
jgi:CelD/BcsL family acetyltransferase involved in cellulose biosynthesis